MLPAPTRPLLGILRFVAFWMTVAATSIVHADDEATPLTLSFHRQSVRRFVFSQELPFGKLVPGEIVNLPAMHPVAADLPPPAGMARCAYRIVGDKLEITTPTSVAGDSALYVSGVQPFATYRLDVQSLSPGAEAAIEFATLDRHTRVQVAAASHAAAPLVFRLFKDGQPTREQPFVPAGLPLEPPYRLCVELSGVTLSAYAIKDGETRFLGRLPPGETFGDAIDFRVRSVLAGATFNVATRVPAGGTVVLGEAAAALGSGMGQADIRQVTHADGAPYIEDNRFWFTFSSRGLDTSDSCQGVMSIDPSVFDPRFEGVIVFDRSDGLLRNDYASHVLYEDASHEWRAVTCCFSASPQGRGPTGLAFAHSPHAPLHGLSVMSEAPLTRAQLPARHEDPCLLHDPDTGKWRLLTSCFEKEGLRAELFESDRWDGTYTRLAGPVEYDSTGTLIQKIGSRRYVLSGSAKGPSGKGAVIAYSYPDLHCLGEMKFDLPVTKSGGRIWPGVFPLPAGYPARYMALTMDRANFPDVTGGRNWSYGALYLYWANTPDLDAPYEFDAAAK